MQSRPQASGRLLFPVKHGLAVSARPALAARAQPAVNANPAAFVSTQIDGASQVPSRRQQVVARGQQLSARVRASRPRLGLYLPQTKLSLGADCVDLASTLHANQR